MPENFRFIQVSKFFDINTKAITICDEVEIWNGYKRYYYITYATKGYGFSAKEKEVVTVLHACNDSIAFEMLLHRCSECFVIISG